MCGITGFLGFPTGARAEAVLRAMTDAITHRGPDDEGFWLDEERQIALGHRRLSIIDLSPQGHQPMRSADGRYVIVYNGEIYNFEDVRRELEAAGRAPPWRGHSDTEVILAAVSAWGFAGALERFTGMFAIALWDREESALLLARDRLGEKPLYFGWSADAFFFASELKALRRWPGWQATVDRNAVALLMRHNYVPGPYSIYERVFKLPPGTYMRVALRDARNGPGPDPFSPLPTTTYWSLRGVVDQSRNRPFGGSEAEAVAELDRLLRASVRRQMVADVPLGAFLSGGVDSSTIVALMQAQSGRPVRTFTIGFEEEGYDEAGHAKAVARHLGTDHIELYVSPGQAMAVIPKLPSFYDEPFSDSSQIPTFLVARMAREHVTVSLSGDAGDELFGGYNRYFWGRDIWSRVGPIPGPLRRGAARALTLFTPAQWDGLFRTFGPALPRAARQPNPGAKIHKVAEILGANGPDDLYRGLVSHWKSPAALVPGSREPATILTLSAEQRPLLEDFTERMMYLDALTYLPDDILVKVDRAAMAVSLETRVPLLDHAIVQFAWSLPLGMKVRGGQGKWLLRQVLYRYVPEALIDRPKMGFGVPIDSWLRGPMRDWAESLLGESRLRHEGWFDAATVRAIWSEHLSGRRNWQYHLWDVLMFQAWLDESRRPVPALAA
jgi:asparagine synthase (glutamine-hydrolysing)